MRQTLISRQWSNIIMKHIPVIGIIFVVAVMLSGVGASVASANICAISAENVGNFNRRTPDNATGACELPVPAGTGKYIIIVTAGKSISSNEDCAEVAESGTGNYSSSTCEGTKKEGGSFIKILKSGPFWQVNNTKLPVGATRAVEGNIVPGTVGILFAKVAGKTIEVVCKKFTPTISIFNATQNGESLGKAVFEECVIREDGVTIKECEVNPEAKPKNSITTEEVRNSLWYHVTNLNKTKTALQQILFAPRTSKVFVTIEIANLGCGALEGLYKVEGNVAGASSPENTEVTVGKLTFGTEQQKHLWLPGASPEETQVQLLFNKTEATIRGEDEIKLKTGEKFGVIE
jgi:hypothetical protein